jgi:hypothetical protein
VLGFDEAAGGDEVFRDLLLERIVEPTSKADSLRVLEETGLASPGSVTCSVSVVAILCYQAKRR